MKLNIGFVNLSLVAVAVLALTVFASAVFLAQNSTRVNPQSQADDQEKLAVFHPIRPQDVFNESGAKEDNVYNAKPAAWIGNGGSRDGQFLGIHFSGQPVPQGASVVSAKFSVTPPSTAWIGTAFDIYAEQKGGPTEFSASFLPSARNFTTARKQVREDVKWLGGQSYSFDVSEPIKELIAKYGTDGKINIIIQGKGSPFARKFFSRTSPRLEVVYSANISTPFPTKLPTPLPSVSPTAGPTKTLTPTPPIKQTPTVVPSTPPMTSTGNGGYPVIPTTVPPGQPTPVAGEKCPDWLHNEYKVKGPDGQMYATWHPVTEPYWQCNFWHEHGSDPRKYIGFGVSGMPTFGYVVSKTGIPSPHNGYKVYVVNDNMRGKAMLRTLHYGSGSPLRSQIRWHELQIVEVSRFKPDELLIDVRQMMDFGHAPNCGQQLGGKEGFPDISGYDYLPYSTLDRNGKNWSGNALFRAVNVYCPGKAPDGVLFQDTYEQWQGAINIGDIFRTMANYNLGSASTLINPNNLSETLFHCNKANAPDKPNCPGLVNPGNQRQLKYFGETVNNTTGNPTVYANPFGKIVPANDPMAVRQYVTLSGWNTFGRSQPDGITRELNHNGYKRFGLNEDDGVYIPGDHWHAFGKGIVRWPN